MLTAPYVTTAAFGAHPTLLDLLGLRSGDTSTAHQTAELYNILLMASSWADDYVNGGDDGRAGPVLGAHAVTENARIRPDRQGRLKFHPTDKPVRRVTGLSWGYQPNSLQAATDLTGVWVERGKQIVVELVPLGTQFGQLQFGGPVLGTEVYTTWTYVAGYPTTTLAADAAAAATSVVVADPTGIYPGDTLRLWDPGVEEAVTVASGYVAGSTTVPLVAALANAHTAGAGFSALPPAAHNAVIMYATALLMRPDTVKEDEFPDAPAGSESTRAKDPRQDGSGLVAEAKRLLQPYRRVR